MFQHFYGNAPPLGDVLAFIAYVQPFLGYVQPFLGYFQPFVWDFP